MASNNINTNEKSEKLNAWWEKFTASVNALNYGIDFTKKESLARFFIIHYTEVSTDLRDSAENGGEEFAFIPKNNANKKFEEMSDEETLNAISEGKPSDEELERLYNASAEGMLFIRPPFTSNEHAQQIATFNSGEVKIYHDFTSLEHEDGKKMADISNALIATDREPKKPAWYTYVFAFFGGKQSKRAVSNYNSNKERYDEGKEFLKNVNPEEVKFARAQYRATNEVFQPPVDEEAEERNKRIDALLKDAEIEKEHPGVIAVKKAYDKLFEERQEEITRKVKKLAIGDPNAKEEWRRKPHDLGMIQKIEPKEVRETIRKELSEAVADLSVLVKTSNDMKKEYREGTLTIESMNRYYDSVNPDSELHNEIIQGITSSKNHNKVIDSCSGALGNNLRKGSNYSACERYLSEMKKLEAMDKIVEETSKDQEELINDDLIKEDNKALENDMVIDINK